MAAVVELKLQLQNDIKAIDPANESARSWLSQQQVSPEVSYFVSLALEELVTNCIKYGYDDTNEHIIDVLLSLTDKTLTMIVVDDGHEFDPLLAPGPDLNLPIEDRPIGGLGIHLLRQMADDITYERRENQNRLTLTKQIS